MKTDTIAAIATAMTNSGIGIIRISGEDAFTVIDRIYQSKNGKKNHGFTVLRHKSKLHCLFKTVSFPDSVRLSCRLRKMTKIPGLVRKMFF